jgi:hypothetical protein
VASRASRPSSRASRGRQGTANRSRVQFAPARRTMSRLIYPARPPERLPSPNPRLQRTPAALPPSPLSRKPLDVGSDW